MHAIKGPGEVVGGHWPYVESLVLDEDVTPNHDHTPYVRITHGGVLFLCRPRACEGAFVDCLSLMKALRMAFPHTFAEVNEARTPAYDRFRRELEMRIATSTALDPVEI
jgi:hypothetical protein